MLAISNTINGLNVHYAAIVGCAAAFTAASVITLGMRVVSKILTRAPFAFEDYTIFLATAIYIVTEGLLIKGVTVGRHSTTVNDPPDMVLSKMIYIYSIFYFAVIALSVASILLMYRRVFVKPFMRHATTLLLIVTLCWWIPCMVIETGYFDALPGNFHGEPKNTMPLRLNYLDWWLSMGIIEQVILIVAIFLPVREIYALQLDFHKRLSMMFVFAVSYICVGTGIARLATIYHPSQPDFDVSLGDVWISSHLGTAIMSANLPVCWPIVFRTRRVVAGIFSKSSQSGRTQHSELTSKKAGRGLHFRSAGSAKCGASDVESVFEAATVGPVTKDGNTRHDTMAEELGATNPRTPRSDASADSNEKQQGAQNVGGGRTTSGRLELRPISWRFSGSMFTSQKT